jgi:hypothetical protein
VRLEGSGKFKNPMTSSGIEPETFRLVAQRLNQLRYRVPLNLSFVTFTKDLLAAVIDRFCPLSGGGTL